jgi:hypothetical protein
MYFSMGHMMFGWPLPAFFHDNHIAMGLIQLLLAGIVMVINQKFFISGYKSLFHGAPNMDTLIALGSSAAFGYSTCMLFAMTRAQVDGNTEAVSAYMMEFYFESAAMILTLITVGKMLEAYSKGKTTNALRGLMKLAPQTAVLLREGQEVTVPVGVWKVGEDIPVGHWSISLSTSTSSKWASVKYCDRLDKTGTDAGNQFDCDIYAYLDVAAPTNDRYPQVIDLDVKPGTYIIIGHGSVVFTPYSGKPDLGFK